MKRVLPIGLCLSALAGCNSAKEHYDLHNTLALLIITGIIGLFFVLALYSNLLRDEVNDCDAFNAHAEKLRKKHRLKFIKSDNPFSLSRVQLAVWTVVISCSYIYLQLCMANCVTTDINQTALVLMGVSATVTTAGTIIDKREMQDARNRHQNAPSDGFFIDILSDNNGISIHRFQNVVWTVIAMIVYLNKVYAIKTGCALPELDETLLALTGISSATYLAIKMQENSPQNDGVYSQDSLSNQVQPPVTAASSVALPVVACQNTGTASVSGTALAQNMATAMPVSNMEDANPNPGIV